MWKTLALLAGPALVIAVGALTDLLAADNNAVKGVVPQLSAKDGQTSANAAEKRGEDIQTNLLVSNRHPVTFWR